MKGIMLSHPGKDLGEHLDNVNELAKIIIASKDLHFKNYKKIDIENVLECICITHDFGKATSFFQLYIAKEAKKSELTHHSLFGAIWAFILTKERLHNEKLACFSFVIVKNHHGNLEDMDGSLFVFEEREKANLDKQLDSFDIEYINKNINTGFTKETFSRYVDYLGSRDFRSNYRQIEFDIEDYLLVNLLFSILISCDKGDAIYFDRGEKYDRLKAIKALHKDIPPNSVDIYKRINIPSKNRQINKLRERLYVDVEANLLKLYKSNLIFSITAPTGAGKTLAVLNAALKLRRETGNYRHIIYALPFTSIIDQNFDVFSSVLAEPASNVLLKHHHLAERIYKNEEEESDEYSISEYLIEDWDSEIVVTTFVQLLETLFSNRNKALKKFHQLANAIIILDEVQSVPHKYWSLIHELFIKVAGTFDTYILLMTATMPLIFHEDKKEIAELLTDKGNYFQQFNRINIDINKEQNEMIKISMESFKEQAIAHIRQEKEKHFLFVFNTIASSIDFYSFAKKNTDREIIYLSSNIVPAHRSERIARIKRKLKEGEKDFIVVSTQIVEAGVDIDIDIVYRDFGPLDSVNQVAGRCNRNSDNAKGVVNVVRLVNEKGREYSGFIYDYNLLYATQNTLNDMADEIIEEKDLYEISNTYFNKLNEIKSNDKSDRILDLLCRLKYDEAFRPDNKDRFKLIEEKDTINVFIEIDNNAQKLYSRYLELGLHEPFERREIFSAFKNDFLSYVISIPSRYWQRERNNTFNRISYEEIENAYSLETGYNRSDYEDIFF